MVFVNKLRRIKAKTLWCEASTPGDIRFATFTRCSPTSYANAWNDDGGEGTGAGGCMSSSHLTSTAKRLEKPINVITPTWQEIFLWILVDFYFSSRGRPLTVKQFSVCFTAKRLETQRNVITHPTPTTTAHKLG